MCLWVVRKRTLCLMGLPSSRYGPLVVGCMSYIGVCGLCRSTRLACHVVCPELALLRIEVVVFLKQSSIWWVGVLFWIFFRFCCVLLRLRTNTVRTEHRTLYISPNLRTTPITTLRFSKDYHHCGNVNTYTLYYTYICSRLCTLVNGYVLTVMYVCVCTLLLNKHLIEQP
jgi:hypothetical protein